MLQAAKRLFLSIKTASSPMNTCASSYYFHSINPSFGKLNFAVAIKKISLASLCRVPVRSTTFLHALTR